MYRKERVRGTKSGMIVGKTATYKKAIVTLIEGDSIDFIVIFNLLKMALKNSIQ